MREHSIVSFRVAEHLSHKYAKVCSHLRASLLSRSAAEKLAKLLVQWWLDRGSAYEPGRIELAMTHEEIAQRIGTSRETVTRVLIDMRKKRLIELSGSTLIIRNISALEALARNPALPAF